jgi:hypothetical protein
VETRVGDDCDRDDSAGSLATGSRGGVQFAALIRFFGISTSGTRPSPYMFFSPRMRRMSAAMRSAAATSVRSKRLRPTLSRRSMKPTIRRPRPISGTASSRSLLPRKSTSASRLSSARPLVSTGSCVEASRCTSGSFVSTVRRSAARNAYDVTSS